MTKSVKTAASVDVGSASFGLSAELLELKAEVEEFARERLRQRAVELEWETDPARRVAWDLLDEASARGWRTFGLPRSEGGAGASAVAPVQRPATPPNQLPTAPRTRHAFGSDPARRVVSTRCPTCRQSSA